VSSVRSEFAVIAHRVLDVDGDKRSDLLAIGRNGEVRVWHWDPKAGRLPEAPSGVLVLPEPERSVLAVADVLGRGGPPQLCVLSRRGLEAYPVGTDGAYGRAPVLVSKDAAFGLRVGTPTFSEILRDVNGDGRPDLLLPRTDSCELWLWTPPAAEGLPPSYRRTGAFRVEVSRERTTEAEALSDVLESSFRIPPLSFRDVNGDGRMDLLVEDGHVRAFHLARQDGTFAVEPDVRVDIETFQDTTPGAEVRLGRTLAGGEEQRFDANDLDGDDIPDYVISHRRKVWVFRGGKAGPQFTDPWQILRVSDDVSMMLVARIGADERPDLLLLRLQVPTVATILRGLVASWDVEIGAVGYENASSEEGGRRAFALAPKWKGAFDLRLPAILGILKDPEALIQRFEGLASKLGRGFLWGDFDGDGKEDAAIASASERRLDLWYGLEREKDTRDGADTELGEIFFGEEKVWDLERVLGWIGDYADRKFASVTGNRPPSVKIELRPASEADLEGAEAAQFDGAGAQEILVVYTDDAGRAVFDVWR
jgi:hypothetical protein